MVGVLVWLGQKAELGAAQQGQVVEAAAGQGVRARLVALVVLEAPVVRDDGAGELDQVVRRLCAPQQQTADARPTGDTHKFSTAPCTNNKSRSYIYTSYGSSRG